MTHGYTPALILAAVCALAYLPLCARPATRLRSLVKTAAVAALALAAHLAQADPVLVLALGLCALGDLALAQETPRSFLAGVGAFAAGHLAYALLALGHPSSRIDSLLDLPALAPAALMAGCGLVMARLLAPRAGDLRLAVLAYIPIILAMALAMFTLPPGLAWAAALSFAASDSLLACEKFLSVGRARLLAGPAIWILYWGAQAGFLAAFTPVPG